MPKAKMSRPTKKNGLTEHLTGSELFIYDESGRELSVLNRSALFIWSLCDGRHDPDAIRSVLAEIYAEVDETTIRTDVEECLTSLQEAGLIEFTD